MTSKALLNKDELNKLSLPDGGVSALPDATIPLSGTELIPVVQSGTSKKITLEKLVPDVSTAASGEPLNTTATDKITTAAEAAQFLRQAALGGGTWTEIQNALAMGSRKRWLEEQIYTQDINRAHPVWNLANPSFPAPGYFSNVARTLLAPRGNNNTTAPTFLFPGEQTTNRCLMTAFLNNANIDANATPMHTAVGNVVGENGGQTGFTGYDLTETLRLKCTWVLGKFFPISVPGGAWDAGDKAPSIIMYYAMLHRAAFGTYADLLEEVTYHPPMSNMLTYIANRKEADGFQPDENYAREIMQLFTIGLYELNIDGTYKLDANGDRIGTYDNEDVYQMARVFTGLCRMDTADYDPQQSMGNTDWSWANSGQVGPGSYYYETDNADARSHFSYTSNYITHSYCSYDGNTHYTINDVLTDLRELTATTTQAIPASGDIQFIYIASIAGWPRRGTIKIDDEIFHYENYSGDVGQNYFRIYYYGHYPAELRRRGHEMSPVQAHPVGSTIKFWKPYWYPKGVSARLRHYLPFYERGAKYALKGRVNIPANTEPRKNIRMAIEALVNHPNCAPFVAKNFIKYMVTSNPSPGYVARVARVFENDGQGVRGNLGAVWIAILTDPEACNTTQSSQGFGRVRDSFELYAATVRPFHRVSRYLAGQAGNTGNSVYVNNVHQTSLFTGFLNTWTDIRSSVLWPAWAPSIFGYYPMDYSVAPGSSWGLTTPELGAYSYYSTMEVFQQLITRVTSGEPRDAVAYLTGDVNTAQYTLATTSYENTVSGTASASDLVARMNLLMCGGNLSYSKVTVLAEQVSSDVSTDTARQDRITGVMQLMMYTPEFFTQ